MKILDLVQGSPEWLAYRATARNASDASAMLGLSKHKTRNLLIQERATGISQEPSAAMQALFSRGHAAEAAARPKAEEVIGEDLYPVTATSGDGYLSASFDGITMDEGIVWECKLYNAALADYMQEHSDLPDTHWPQVEQQLLISGARMCYFTLCSDDGDIAASHLYVSRPDRRDRIIAGWQQLDRDVADYVHVDPVEKPVAAAVMDLPSVAVTVSGGLSIADNFQAFEDALRHFLDATLIREPKTDQDFADLDGQIKVLKKAEKAMKDCDQAMIAQIETLDTFKRRKDMLEKLVSDNRKAAEKLYEMEKERRKKEIIDSGRDALAAHIAELNKDIAPAVMPAINADFSGAIKGLKSMDSAKNKVGSALVAAKLEANQIADLIRRNQKVMLEHATGYELLFADMNQILLKPTDDLVLLVKARIAAHEEAIAQKVAQQMQEVQSTGQAAYGGVAPVAPYRDDVRAAHATLNKHSASLVDGKYPKVARPHDGQIILAIMERFNVDSATAIQWIKELDLKEAAEWLEYADE